MNEKTKGSLCVKILTYMLSFLMVYMQILPTYADAILIQHSPNKRSNFLSPTSFLKDFFSSASIDEQINPASSLYKAIQALSSLQAQMSLTEIKISELQNKYQYIASLIESIQSGRNFTLNEKILPSELKALKEQLKAIIESRISEAPFTLEELDSSYIQGEYNDYSLLRRLYNILDGKKISNPGVTFHNQRIILQSLLNSKTDKIQYLNKVFLPLFENRRSDEYMQLFKEVREKIPFLSHIQFVKLARDALLSSAIQEQLPFMSSAALEDYLNFKEKRVLLWPSILTEVNIATDWNPLMIDNIFNQVFLDSNDGTLRRILREEYFKRGLNDPILNLRNRLENTTSDLKANEDNPYEKILNSQSDGNISKILKSHELAVSQRSVESISSENLSLIQDGNQLLVNLINQFKAENLNFELSEGGYHNLIKMLKTHLRLRLEQREKNSLQADLQTLEAIENEISTNENENVFKLGVLATVKRLAEMAPKFMHTLTAILALPLLIISKAFSESTLEMYILQGLKTDSAQVLTISDSGIDKHKFKYPHLSLADNLRLEMFSSTPLDSERQVAVFDSINTTSTLEARKAMYLEDIKRLREEERQFPGDQNLVFQSNRLRERIFVIDSTLGRIHSGSPTSVSGIASKYNLSIDPDSGAIQIPENTSNSERVVVDAKMHLAIADSIISLPGGSQQWDLENLRNHLHSAINMGLEKEYLSRAYYFLALSHMINMELNPEDKDATLKYLILSRQVVEAGTIDPEVEALYSVLADDPTLQGENIAKGGQISEEERLTSRYQNLMLFAYNENPEVYPGAQSGHTFENDLKQLITDYTQYKESHPDLNDLDFGEIMYRLGRLSLLGNNTEEASLYFLASIESDPKHPDATAQYSALKTKNIPEDGVQVVMTSEKDIQDTMRVLNTGMLTQAEFEALNSMLADSNRVAVDSSTQQWQFVVDENLRRANNINASSENKQLAYYRLGLLHQKTDPIKSAQFYSKANLQSPEVKDALRQLVLDLKTKKILTDIIIQLAMNDAENAVPFIANLLLNYATTELDENNLTPKEKSLLHFEWGKMLLANENVSDSTKTDAVNHIYVSALQYPSNDSAVLQLLELGLSNLAKQIVKNNGGIDTYENPEKIRIAFEKNIPKEEIALSNTSDVDRLAEEGNYKFYLRHSTSVKAFQSVYSGDVSVLPKIASDLNDLLLRLPKNTGGEKQLIILYRTLLDAYYRQGVKNLDLSKLVSAQEAYTNVIKLGGVVASKDAGPLSPFKKMIEINSQIASLSTDPSNSTIATNGGENDSATKVPVDTTKKPKEPTKPSENSKVKIATNILTDRNTSLPLAIAAYANKDFEVAIKLFEESLPQLENSKKDKVKLAIAFRMLGYAYNQTENWNKAIAAFTKALELAGNRLNDPENAKETGNWNISAQMARAINMSQESDEKELPTQPKLSTSGGDENTPPVQWELPEQELISWTTAFKDSSQFSDIHEIILKGWHKTGKLSESGKLMWANILLKRALFEKERKGDSPSTAEQQIALNQQIAIIEFQLYKNRSALTGNQEGSSHLELAKEFIEQAKALGGEITTEGKEILAKYDQVYPSNESDSAKSIAVTANEIQEDKDIVANDEKFVLDISKASLLPVMDVKSLSQNVNNIPELWKDFFNSRNKEERDIILTQIYEVLKSPDNIQKSNLTGEDLALYFSLKKQIKLESEKFEKVANLSGKPWQDVRSQALILVSRENLPSNLDASSEEKIASENEEKIAAALSIKQELLDNLEQIESKYHNLLQDIKNTSPSSRVFFTSKIVMDLVDELMTTQSEIAQGIQNEEMRLEVFKTAQIKSAKFILESIVFSSGQEKLYNFHVHSAYFNLNRLLTAFNDNGAKFNSNENALRAVQEYFNLSNDTVAFLEKMPLEEGKNLMYLKDQIGRQASALLDQYQYVNRNVTQAYKNSRNEDMRLSA